MPGMNISVAGRLGIWNRRIDIGLLLNFGKGKVEAREKGGLLVVIGNTIF